MDGYEASPYTATAPARSYREPALERQTLQGAIRDRVAGHLSTGQQSQHRQAPFLGEPLECSGIVNPAWARHHRLELETDLIGAHVLVTGWVSAAQFLG
jgi:hypothetical protein